MCQEDRHKTFRREIAVRDASKSWIFRYVVAHDDSFSHLTCAVLLAIVDEVGSLPYIDVNATPFSERMICNTMQDAEYDAPALVVRNEMREASDKELRLIVATHADLCLSGRSE